MYVQDLVVQSATEDPDVACAALRDRADEFDEGLAKAVDSHDLSRAIGLPQECRRQVHASLIDGFEEINNSTESAMRIYTKTKRHKIVKDNQSALSVKRARGEDEKAGQGGADATAEPKSKTAKVSSGRKVPVSDVRELVDGLVDRFGAVIGDLCEEIRRLNGELDSWKGTRSRESLSMRGEQSESVV